MRGSGPLWMRAGRGREERVCVSSVNLMMGRTHLLALFITEQEAVTLQFEIYLEERGRDMN